MDIIKNSVAESDCASHSTCSAFDVLSDYEAAAELVECEAPSNVATPLKPCRCIILKPNSKPSKSCNFVGFKNAIAFCEHL